MIFLDSGYFKGIYREKDKHHGAAKRIEKDLDNRNETTVINMAVLMEVLNFSVKAGMFAKDIYDDIMSKHKVFPVTHEDLLKSLSTNEDFGNSVNFVDCTIYNTMVDNAINTIVTFDDDFKKIRGFKIISDI